ncbi:MAG: 2-succinyl-5-enolpyruvyl-6-hydroxy-3-cyclohexene-1-carboxylic-acid synthase [Prolixibacteraceae bacterium]|nr:2-succinyl-5-enolpyruvyl-6-hydroxy-3-cyclohexene-1-carboxylic-acid synthase [Prolixibacteraceae bacterium]
MITDKKHVQQLASLLLQKGITDVVISPGSRNAPLINQFFGLPEFNCLNVVDERSAGYQALGIALARQKPVVVVCTSGTAAINYGPAIAEAFYQKIPLVVLTADRPRRWVDQADGQTVRQANLFVNHTLKSISLEEAERDDDFRHNNLQINETLNLVLSGNPGPVHINIPLGEPLYGFSDAELPKFRNIESCSSNAQISFTELEKLVDKWNASTRKMVIAGQLSPDEQINSLVQKMAQDPGTVILAEHLTNLSGQHLVHATDVVVAAISPEEKSKFQPEILLTFGQQIVSKRLKLFVRANQPLEHWHISVSGEHTDTYNSLSRIISSDAFSFLNVFVPEIKNTESNYREIWKAKEQKAFQLQEKYLKEAPFCDLTASKTIAKLILKDSVVHLGNSSSVRLMQMFDPAQGCEYYGNRGTSGIDGSLSTAVGFALSSEKINTIVLGELSFFYDSNALLNQHFPHNLRIIVLNNGGGNIFRLIGGPSQSPALNEHFVAQHNLKAEGLAKAFGINYLKAENQGELSTTLNTIFAPDFSEPVILEVLTDGEISAAVFQECYQQLKN